MPKTGRGAGCAARPFQTPKPATRRLLAIWPGGGKSPICGFLSRAHYLAENRVPAPRNEAQKMGSLAAIQAAILSTTSVTVAVTIVVATRAHGSVVTVAE